MARKTYTISEIAQSFGATWHQAYQAIRRLGIEPCERRAGAKMFDSPARKAVGEWLKTNAVRELVPADSS